MVVNEEYTLMEANVGTADRVIRVVIGLGLLALFVLGDGGWHWFGLLGIVPLATAALGQCPAYRIFGINTCSRK